MNGIHAMLTIIINYYYYYNNITGIDRMQKKNLNAHKTDF